MKKQYISRNGQIEYEIDEAGEILTYGRDALGNVVAGYDKNTNAVFTIDYKPFGEFAAITGTITGRRFLWVGTWGYRFTPGVPVSHYVRARHLMMRMGMWTTVDPLWPSEMAYGYVDGNPIYKVDYSGEQMISAVLACHKESQRNAKRDVRDKGPCYPKSATDGCIAALCAATSSKGLYELIRDLKGKAGAASDLKALTELLAFLKDNQNSDPISSAEDCCKKAKAYTGGVAGAFSLRAKPPGVNVDFSKLISAACRAITGNGRPARTCAYITNTIEGCLACCELNYSRDVMGTTLNSNCQRWCTNEDEMRQIYER